MKELNIILDGKFKTLTSEKQITFPLKTNEENILRFATADNVETIHIHAINCTFSHGSTAVDVTDYDVANSGDITIRSTPAVIGAMLVVSNIENLRYLNIVNALGGNLAKFSFAPLTSFIISASLYTLFYGSLSDLRYWDNVEIINTGCNDADVRLINGDISQLSTFTKLSRLTLYGRTGITGDLTAFLNALYNNGKHTGTLLVQCGGTSIYNYPQGVTSISNITFSFNDAGWSIL